jgi:hypothetical protein
VLDVKSLHPPRPPGIVDSVSSKAARLRRRQAARRKMDKRLCKSGRVPQQTGRMKARSGRASASA